MSRIFDLNNPLWSTMGKLVDVLVLHFFWVICCLPIVTFGPSTIALYYSMMKTVKDENPHYVKTFFRAFKENLKQGIPLGLIMLIMGSLLTYALVFYIRQGNATEYKGMYTTLKVMTIFILTIFVFILQYVFALAARFENTIIQTIKNAFFMSLKNLGWTIVMIRVFAAPYLIIYFTNFVPLFLIAYGLVVFVDSYILNRIFEPYIKEALGDQAEEEKDPDHWEIPDDVLPARPAEPAEEIQETKEE